jgi:hypothetical protein
MKVRGNVVILDKPVYENKAGIELSEKDKKLMEEELFQQYQKLKVHSVGQDVSDIKKGDEVYVAPRVLMHCDVMIIDGKDKFLVRASDILIVY